MLSKALKNFASMASLALVLLAWPDISSAGSQRFQYSGDGTLVLNQQTILFRSPAGSYEAAGLQQIHRIFSAPWDDPAERLSLRFIEFLDYLQDQLKAGSYSLKSGYRSPKLNQALRNRGKLAAQSSMHTEGAAADLFLAGVPSSQVFDHVKALNCCGIGWYHSRHFHLDTGPARYWDEASSKTEDKTPQQNEKIILQADYDRYRSGESVELKFMRVTEYPIGVPELFELVKTGEPKGSPLKIGFPPQVRSENGCRILEERSQIRSLQVAVPEKLPPGEYTLKIRFCNRYNYEKMPEEILSRSFEVRAPPHSLPPRGANGAPGAPTKL